MKIDVTSETRFFFMNWGSCDFCLRSSCPCLPDWFYISLSMANTFSCLNIHYVFSTKERVLVLEPDIRERLWPYMGGIAGMIPKCIGGVSDHVHSLVSLPR